MTTNNDKPTVSKKENVVVISKMETPNLTEKWRIGELKTGWYYVNFYSVGAVMQEYLPEHNGFGYDEKNLIQEVLAPVPSYEEWQQMKAFCEEFNALDVAEENQRLKELLLKCREKLDELDYGCEVWQGELTGFIEEIDEVLK